MAERIQFKTQAGNQRGAKIAAALGREMVSTGLRLIAWACTVRWMGPNGSRHAFRPTIVATFHAEGLTQNDPLAEPELT